MRNTNYHTHTPVYSGNMETINWNTPVKIDPILTLPSRVMLSPLEGVMRPVFCAAVKDLNLIQYWMTPFFSISKDSVPPPAFFRKKLLPFRDSSPLIVQLLGHDPDALAEAALRLTELQVDGINLNFACPSSTVNASGNGGAILKNLPLAEKIIQTVRKAVQHKASLSVKIRCGWQDPAEIPRIAGLLNCCAVPWVICHYRTVSEQYRQVPSGWNRLKQFRDLLDPRITFFGNGDILSRHHAEQMVEQCGCHGVAVGRAFLQNPFLLKQIRDGGTICGEYGQASVLFLKTLLDVPLKHPELADQWSRNGFLECCRMALGRESPLFRQLAGMTEREIRESFAKTEEKI